MDKPQFNPINKDFINRNFNDRRITGKMGIPHTEENGGEYTSKSKKQPLNPHTVPTKEDPFAPKRGPHDPKPGQGYSGHDKGWGGVKPKPKGPKPALPPAAKKSVV